MKKTWIRALYLLALGALLMLTVSCRGGEETVTTTDTTAALFILLSMVVPLFYLLQTVCNIN